MRIGLSLSLARPGFSPGGVWAPADQSGLIAALDPAQSAGQVLSDIFGVCDMQLGSTSGSDTNDPTPGDPHNSFGYDGSDYCYDLDSNQAGHSSNFTGAVTLFAVLKTPASPPASTCVLVARCDSASIPMYCLRVAWGTTPDRIQLLWRGAGVLQSIEKQEDLPAGTWLTVCGTAQWGGTNLQKLYRNCVEKATAANVNAMQAVNTAWLSVGARATSLTPTWTEYEYGRHGPVLVYNAYKTVDQVKAIHNDIRLAYPDFGLPAV